MVIDDYKKAKITRTQSWIINALLKLLKEYPYDVLTITEICQEADVSRVTFYRYFDTKETVLLHYIRILVTNYFEEVKQIKNINFKIHANTYFTYWLKEKDLLMILKENNLEELIIKESSIVEKYINELVISNDNYQMPDLTEVEFLYRQSFNFSGLWRMVFIWVERDFLESVDEMTEILSKMYRPVIFK